MPLGPRSLYQENRGFGLAHTRNNGARGQHPILAVLDGHMIPEAGWLAAHDAAAAGATKRSTTTGRALPVVNDRPFDPVRQARQQPEPGIGNSGQVHLPLTHRTTPCVLSNAE